MLAELEIFHHVYDHNRFELPFGIEVPLPPPILGVQITKFMVLQLVAAGLTIWIFRGLAARIKNGRTVNGWWWNFWEMLALYIRDEVERPIIGDPHHHDEHVHEAHNPLPHGEHQHPLGEAMHIEAAGGSSR